MVDRKPHERICFQLTINNQNSTISLSAYVLDIRNRIGGSCRRKRPQPQHAAVADAARLILMHDSMTKLNRRARPVQGRGERFLALRMADERRHDLDGAFLCARPRITWLKASIIVGRRIGIAGAVRLDGADVTLFRAQDLGPTDRDGEEMRVAEWDVGDRDSCNARVRGGPVER